MKFVRILISWLPSKSDDLSLHCSQKSISGLSETRILQSYTHISNLEKMFTGQIKLGIKFLPFNSRIFEKYR